MPSKKSDKKILLSGVKPTGRPHIGNYFGAMKQFVELQDKHRSFVFIADYHALTTLQNADEMRQNIMDIALDYLAIGLDPEKTVLFKQSDVPEVTELAWIFNCITTVPYLQRAHAYKDAVAKGREVSVGTFDYPMLMAADILMYDADVVPVGQDQKQHVEYARDTAEKFNRIFASTHSINSRSPRGTRGATGSAQATPTFKLPEPLILENVAVVPGIDGQKMSKSYNNTIPLFATKSELTELVMSIVTDSGSDVPKNVYALHTLFRPETELKQLYSANKGHYKVLKEALIADMEAVIQPLRERRMALARDEKRMLEILAEGAKKARAVAQEKMKVVKERIGL